MHDKECEGSIIKTVKKMLCSTSNLVHNSRCHYKGGKEYIFENMKHFNQEFAAQKWYIMIKRSIEVQGMNIVQLEYIYNNCKARMLS